MKRIAILVVLLACGVAAANPTSFTVSVAGKGRPIILIPGLGCPGSVWDDTVAHFAGTAQTHVLTLAGFAGQAPIDGPLSATVRAELAIYIREHKLDHPVIIGHSLGGFIAYWLAAADPDVIGPVIAIDAFPALGYDASSVPGVIAMGEGWKRLAKADFDGQARDMFLAMGADPKKLEPVIAAVLKSDRRTFADSFVELFKVDLRSRLPKITARVLVVLADGPFQQTITEQVAGIASKQVVIVPRTRHFVMFDDPRGFFRAVDGFLAAR